jgi:hypothetical protein
MARPKADLPAAEAIRALVDDQVACCLACYAGRRVRRARSGGRLMAKVRAKPEDGKANAG